MSEYMRRPAGRWSTTHRAIATDGGQAAAAALLMSYHRQVEEWFVEFAQARSRQRKRERACALALQRREPLSTTPGPDAQLTAPALTP